YRPTNEVPPGPDLTGIGSKFDPQRNPQGAAWLYSWIKDPSSYNPRTIMPDLKLDPIVHAPPAESADPANPDAAETSEADAEATITDPIADIVAYLVSSKKEDWEATQSRALPLKPAEQDDLQKLALEYLQGAFYIE